MSLMVDNDPISAVDGGNSYRQCGGVGWCMFQVGGNEELHVVAHLLLKKLAFFRTPIAVAASRSPEVPATGTRRQTRSPSLCAG